MAIAALPVAVDHVTTSVIQGALENIAVEMGYKLMRMSYSSIIRESEDFGAVLVEVQAGDRFICVGPAGGGYGHPHAREPQRVLADVLDGFISMDTARRDFGVVITPEMTVDTNATTAMRARFL